MSANWTFDRIENKHTLYCEKDCIKKFCESVREYAKNIIDFEKKEMLPLKKKRIKITLRCKNMLYLWKTNLNKALQKYKLLEG